MYKDNKRTIDILTVYKNYLISLEMNRLYGSTYGDTLELIRMYEEKLKEYHIKPIKKL